MVDWFMPRRADLPSKTGRGGTAVLRTEVEGPLGVVVVHTRLMESMDWETSICPGNDAHPDNPDSAVFAECNQWAEAEAAHEQAIDFVVRALTPREGAAAASD